MRRGRRLVFHFTRFRYPALADPVDGPSGIFEIALAGKRRLPLNSRCMDVGLTVRLRTSHTALQSHHAGQAREQYRPE